MTQPNLLCGLRRVARVRARARGAATVEAAIALPVFIIVFAGTLFARDKYLAVEDAEAKARTCAWQYSAANCQLVPTGCEGVLTPGVTPSSHSADVDNVLSDASDLATSGDDSYGVIEKVVGQLITPVLAQVFGQFAQANTSAQLSKPALFGGGQATVGGRYHLACNVAAKEPADVVSDVWDDLTK